MCVCVCVCRSLHFSCSLPALCVGRILVAGFREGLQSVSVRIAFRFSNRNRLGLWVSLWTSSFRPDKSLDRAHLSERLQVANCLARLWPAEPITPFDLANLYACFATLDIHTATHAARLAQTPPGDSSGLRFPVSEGDFGNRKALVAECRSACKLPWLVWICSPPNARWPGSVRQAHRPKRIETPPLSTVCVCHPLRPVRPAP